MALIRCRRCGETGTSRENPTHQTVRFGDSVEAEPLCEKCFYVMKVTMHGRNRDGRPWQPD